MGPRSPRRRGPRRPNFHGSWVCTSTWGLDAFLRANGVSKMQRMVAERAPWPSWEFEQDGDSIVFINHCFVGDLREEFKVGGPEYTTRDGHKQLLTCKAFWEEGDMPVLVLERRGPQGRFREERHLDKQGQLHFKLRALEDGKEDTAWGRTF